MGSGPHTAKNDGPLLAQIRRWSTHGPADTNIGTDTNIGSVHPFLDVDICNHYLFPCGDAILLLFLSNSYCEQNSSSWCLKNGGEAALDMSAHPDLFSCWQTETIPTNTDTLSGFT